MNDSDNPKLDNELAELTDALLAGQQIAPSEATQDMAPVLRELQALTTPVQPSTAFRSRLTQRLSTEFDAQGRTKRTTQTTMSGVFRRYRSVLTAAAVLILVGAAVLLGNQFVIIGMAQGQGSAATTAVISIFVVVLVVIGAFFWWRERK